MRRGRLIATGTVFFVVVGMLAGCSSSSKTSATTTPPTTGGATVPTTVASGNTVHVTVSDTKGLAGPMTLVVAPASVQAGDVTFVVKNTGTIDHEVIVLKTSLAFDKIPVADAGDPPAPVTSGANKVDEKGNVGETGDPNVKPGESRSFTIKNMTAGTYALVCNIAQHYAKGMRGAFSVT